MHTNLIFIQQTIRRQPVIKYNPPLPTYKKSYTVSQNQSTKHKLHIKPLIKELSNK